MPGSEGMYPPSLRHEYPCGGWQTQFPREKFRNVPRTRAGVATEVPNVLDKRRDPGVVSKDFVQRREFCVVLGPKN